MKKTVAIFLLIVMLLTVSSCKTNNEPDENKSLENTDMTVLNDDTNSSEKDKESNQPEDSIQPSSDDNKENEPNTGEIDNGNNQSDSEGTDADDSNEGKIVSSVENLYIHTPADELAQRAELIMICRFDGRTVQVEPDDTASAEFANSIYTDRYVTPLKVAKGNPAESIPIRTVGGESGNIVYSSDEPVLQAGKSYFVYLKQGTQIRRDDVVHYKMFAGYQSCIPINDDGTLDIRYVDAEDIEEVTQLYESVK